MTLLFLLLSFQGRQNGLIPNALWYNWYYSPTDAGSSEELCNIMEWYDEADSFIYTDFCLFSNNKIDPDKTYEKSDHVWKKTRLVIRMLNITTQLNI
jgi:hypothetical protein